MESVYADGTNEEAMKDKFYYKDGTVVNKHDFSNTLHRADGPACEYTNGDREWYVDGKPHRVDGPAAEYANGDRFWYVDGRLHRIGGPAVEWGEWADGDKEWCIEGEYYTEEEFNKFIQEVKELPLALRLIDPREWVRKTAEMECMKQ